MKYRTPIILRRHRVGGPDEYGQDTGTWYTWKNIWADVELSPSTAQQPVKGETSTATLKVRPDRGLLNLGKLRAVVTGKTYEIEVVDTVDPDEFVLHGRLVHA